MGTLVQCSFSLWRFISSWYHWLLASNLLRMKPVYADSVMFLIHSKSNLQYFINSLHVEMVCMGKQNVLPWSHYLQLYIVVYKQFTWCLQAWNIQLISKLSKGSIPTLSENWTPFALWVEEKASCLASLVPTPRVSLGEKQSGEQSRFSWAYSPKWWKTNEIARSLIIT